MYVRNRINILLLRLRGFKQPESEMKKRGWGYARRRRGTLSRNWNEKWSEKELSKVEMKICFLYFSLLEGKWNGNLKVFLYVFAGCECGIWCGEMFMAFVEYAVIFCICFWFGFKSQKEKDEREKEEEGLKDYLKSVFEDEDVRGSLWDLLKVEWHMGKMVVGVWALLTCEYAPHLTPKNEDIWQNLTPYPLFSSTTRTLLLFHLLEFFTITGKQGYKYAKEPQNRGSFCFPSLNCYFSGSCI